MKYSSVPSFFDENTKRVTDLDKLNLVKPRNVAMVLGSSQFSILPQLPQKGLDSKLTISLC